MGDPPKILRRTADDAFLVECRFCDGDGKHPADDFNSEWTHDARCPVCEGVGAFWLPAGSSEPTACRMCNGTGRGLREGYFSGDTCGVCHGRAVIDLARIAPRVDEPDPLGFWAMLHPTVVEVSRERFEDGHYADAVEAAFKEFNKQVKSRAGEAAGERDGARLMRHVFSVDRPVLRLDNTKTPTARSIQEGYMHMFAGAMTGVRNPKAHDNIVITPDRAIHFLFVASLFMQKLDEATKV